MLKPLVTSFSVIGGGLKALKEIKKNYENLRNNFKKGEKNNRFFTAIKNGANLVKESFIKMSKGFQIISAKSNAFATNLETKLFGINKKSNTLLGTFGKIAGLLGGGFAVKTAFEGATETEMNRTAIMAMRGEKRADELMSFGINFANTTPFQTGEVLEAIKKLEIRGLDPTEWLRGVGDMSAMLGKSLDQGVEAVLDAVTGEFERLKEFGITSKMLQEMFPTRFNNNGSIKDIKGFIDDLMKYMIKKYKGGTEILAKTTTGLLSTVKGMYGSFTNMLLSGTATGEILDNSPLGILRTEILQPLANDLIQWSQDGTFKRWSEDFSKAFGNIFSVLKTGFSIIKEYKEGILALIGVFMGMKATIGAAAFWGSLTAALATPAGQIMAFISLVVFLAVTIIRNMDKIKEVASDLWSGIKDIVVTVFKSMLDFPNELLKSFKRGWENIKTAFGFNSPKIETPEKTKTPQKPITIKEYRQQKQQEQATRVKTLTNNSTVINFTLNGVKNDKEMQQQIEQFYLRQQIAGGEI